MKYLKKYQLFETHINDFLMNLINSKINLIGFLETGGDINVLDEDGGTLLHLCVEYDKESIFELILNEPYYGKNKADINIRNKYNNSAFRNAFNFNMLEKLLKRDDLKLELEDVCSIFEFASKSLMYKTFIKAMENNIDWKRKINNRYFFEYYDIKLDGEQYIDETIDMISKKYPEVKRFYEKIKKSKEFNL